MNNYIMKTTKETSFWKPVKIDLTKVKVSNPLFDFPKATNNIPTKSVNFIDNKIKVKYKNNLKPKTFFGVFSSKPIAILKNVQNTPKKNMNWYQAKTKYPKLNPFKDADKDGVINMLDCKPFNKKKQ